MSQPEVYRITDHAELFSLATSAFFDAVIEFPDERIVVALPGGRSIQPFLEHWVLEARSLPRKHWSRLDLFMVDERAVPISHADSNFGLVRRLLSPLIESGLLLVEQFHPFEVNESEPDFGAARYSEALKLSGGRFHIAWLGVGEDAHVGALFPLHHSIQNLSPNFIALTDSPKPPPRRVTASRELLKRASLLGAFVIGEAKRDALNLLLSPQGSVEECPARVIYAVEKSFVFSDLA